MAISFNSDNIDLKDTNMANYGGKDHRHSRQKSAALEKAWKNAGKKKGIQIWRVEAFRVKKWPKSRYGEFYSGDSYIILHTKVDDNGKKTYDAFFWLGAETTQDEAGTAAYKTVELDDYLGDEPVQYREVQGNESKSFLNLFPKVTILDGGIESGFRHVSPKKYKPRLLHVCGYKKHVQVYQVALNVSSLNNSDSFVLDCGLRVFQFNGQYASPWEKRKANAIIDELQASRLGKIESTFIIDGLIDDNNPLIDEFWKYFGGKPNNIIEEVDEKSVAVKHELSMHHVCDASGVTEINEICRGVLDKTKLDTMDTFIIDGGGMVFVWIGKGSTKNEKREAMLYAVRYLTDEGRDKTVPIQRVIEGKESKEFWGCFDGKIISNTKKKRKRKKKKNKTKKKIKKKGTGKKKNDNKKPPKKKKNKKKKKIKTKKKNIAKGTNVNVAVDKNVDKDADKSVDANSDKSMDANVDKNNSTNVDNNVDNKT